MRCKDCKYAKSIQIRGTNKAYQCFCDHPDKGYVANYFAENHMVKMVGFLGFSEPYKPEPKIKTAPKWCPLKKEVD